MKRVSFSLLLIFLVGVYVAQAQSNFAVVKSNGTTIITSTFKKAIDTSANGDIIYLPAGTIDVNGVQVNKGVHLIGAGYHPDSTGGGGQTVFSNGLVIVKGADGGSLQGVHCNSDIAFGTGTANNEVHNYAITRCYINSALYLSFAWNQTTNGSDFMISENIIRYGICGGKAKNVTVTKNFIVQVDVTFRPFTFFDGAIISNNIIFPVDGATSNDVLNTTFKNNIITAGNLGYVNGYSGNIYINNLHTAAAGLNTFGVVQSTGNVYMPWDKIFVKYNGSFNYTVDCHLTSAALAAINGNDGTQVGIYGTSTPFKDGGLPLVPVIKQAKVSTKSNAKGKLEVEFKVQAQSK